MLSHEDTISDRQQSVGNKGVFWPRTREEQRVPGRFGFQKCAAPRTAARASLGGCQGLGDEWLAAAPADPREGEG